MCHEENQCPECEWFDDFELQRRDFLRIGGAAALTVATANVFADDESTKPAKRAAKPAEALIREFHASLSAQQTKQLVLPWDHKRRDGKLSRLGTYNSAILGKKLGQHLTKPQQELVERILKSMLSDDEAWERITRYGKWDASKSFENTGCVIFGDPSGDQKFSWVFSGHHLTLRCDGNSEPGAAFGGPIYYGHLLNGYDARNVYRYQTQHVQAVFDALDEKQQAKAIADRNPGDRERGIQFPNPTAPKPGIGFSELADNQQALVEKVMRTLLQPFRKEDADEVMQIVKAGGGMEKVHLAFYEDGRGKDDKVRWNFWRLEGPGFIWNYRVLPHVHCYVNINQNA